MNEPPPKMMSRGPRVFRQSDITAAVKGATAAGLKVKRVEITPDGRIVVTANGEQNQESSGTDLDRELADWEKRRGS